MKKEVIVTCGGTSEPIDDVRVLTNISTGRFGHALAEALATHEVYEVTELCPKATLERLGERENVSYSHYRTTEDLQSALYDREKAPDIVLQAAAVSDYRPIAHEGKLPSHDDVMTLTLERTPKLLATMRDTFGPKTFIVGFKLLSGVTRKELIDAATKQLKDYRLNMVIANDLQTLTNGQHPVLVATAEGGVIPFDGDREDVARQIADLIHQREQVAWFKSVHAEGVEGSSELTERFAHTLAAAKTMNLLTDASGNISVRSSSDNGHLLVSPRGVDKSKLSVGDALPARVNVQERIIRFGELEGGATGVSAANADAVPAHRAGHKPSIDTGVEAIIYDSFPQVEAVIHFHRGWGRMDVKTEFPYPCGVEEEGIEILEAWNRAGFNIEDNLSVELVHHGFLLGVTMDSLEMLTRRWHETLEEFRVHLEEVNPVNPTDALKPLDASRYRPIWQGQRIMGVIHDDPEAAVVYLTEASRGTGLGRVIVDQLITRGYVIQTVNDCHVRDFYRHFGFSETERDGIYRLTPPLIELRREF